LANTAAPQLRAAADLLRLKALSVPREPWTLELLGEGTSHPGYPQRVTNAQAIIVAETFEGRRPEQLAIGPYLVLLHPGMGLAVADLLDALAADMEENPDMPGAGWDAATRIADAILRAHEALPTTV